MRLFTIIVFIFCFFQTLNNCSAVYTIPVYKEHDNVCFDKIYKFIDDEQNFLCKKYKICKLFVCVGDMVFGWFVNGAKKIFDCLKEDEAMKQMHINEFVPSKEIENEIKSDQHQHQQNLEVQKKNVIKKRRPITNNRKIRAINKKESIEQPPIVATIPKLPSPKEKHVLVDNINVPAEKVANKISFRNVDLRKCYNLFLGAHLMTIFIASYKFVRSFYRWAPLNLYDITLRNLTSNVDNRRVDVATEANDTDSEETDTEDL